MLESDLTVQCPECNALVGQKCIQIQGLIHFTRRVKGLMFLKHPEAAKEIDDWQNYTDIIIKANKERS